LRKLKFDDVTAQRPGEEPDDKESSLRKLFPFLGSLGATLIVEQGVIPAMRLRIDLSKPFTTSEISLAKTGVTIDFLYEIEPDGDGMVDTNLVQPVLDDLISEITT
jgi:hypothetical protein